MKTSFVATVFNEEHDIKSFIDSILSQTDLPDEIIIVDAGSKDRTDEILKSYGNKIKLYVVKGNRSLGRNFGIRKAQGDIVLVSDAGCILDKNWAKNLIEGFSNQAVDVVSGYYHPVANNTFQKSLAMYTCVMPDRLDPKTFLPSSRSIAFKKSTWEAVGGYPEYLDTCEDLVFAKKLKDKGFQFSLAKHAIANWRQQKNIFQAFKQFYNYAVGDGMAQYFRPQTPFLFLRYVIGLCLLAYALYTNNQVLLVLLVLLFVLYIIWAIGKNYRYVNKSLAFLYLPVLQFTSDIAVLLGTTIGVGKSLVRKN